MRKGYTALMGWLGGFRCEGPASLFNVCTQFLCRHIYTGTSVASNPERGTRRLHTAWVRYVNVAEENAT
jgi:hypothetical protein